MSSTDRSGPGPSRRLIVGVALAVAVLSVLPLLFSVNTTPSVTPGIYATVPTWTPGVGPAEPGGLVVACPPAVALLDTALERGYVPRSRSCASGARPFLKRVLATAGQTVRLDTTGLWLDGARTLPPPPTTDSQGRAIQPAYGEVTLSADELWLASDAERGFDSRYLGPFSLDDVHARAFLAVPF